MSHQSLLEPSAGEGLKAADTGIEFHLADYLPVLRRRWRLIAVCLLLGLVVGAAQYAVTPRMYQATSVLQIERRNLTQLVGAQSWLENWWNMEFYPTQYKLLESRGLAERVVQNLRLTEDPFFNPSAVGAAGNEPPTPQDDARVTARLASSLRGGLSVTPVRRTQLVRLSYRSSDPEKAALIANGFADAFIDWGIETRSRTAGVATEFLTTQLASLKTQIAEKEAQLQSFSRSAQIVSLESGSSAAVRRLESLTESYNEAEQTRVQKEARYRELLRTPKETVADRGSDGLVSEMTKDLLLLERDYETKLKTYKPDWPEMVDLKSRIESQQRDLQEVVDETAEQARRAAYAEYQTALREERALESQIVSSKSETLDQNSEAAQYANLRTEIQSLRELHDQLLQRQSETQVTANLQNTEETNVRVVDSALVPGGPYQPNLKKNLSSGMFLGLLLGLGTVILLEYLDRTVKTAEEAERLMGLPTLAVIPDVSESGRSYRKRGYGSYGYGYGYGAATKRRAKTVLERRGDDEALDIELLPENRPRLAVSEAYRSLRTALLLSSADELKAVAVTSAEAAEGKSTTATNLAVVMAQLGRRVLIVDADLRKPRQHKIFDLSNRFGLVNCITGSAEPGEICLPTRVTNLQVMPSGPIPPNPSELLASERMRSLIKFLRGRFDFVVLDTPPVLAVSDPILVGTATDGVVLCMGAGSLMREDARACRDRLALADLKVLGLVLNRFRAPHKGYNRRYYQEYTSYAMEEQADSAA